MRRQLLAIAALSAAVALGTATSAVAAEPVWQETGTAYVDSLGGGQGLASRADGSLLHRGPASIPLDLRLKGWNHIGDPDIAEDHVFDAYQGADSATSKMFAVTTPDGKRYEYVHQLDAGEKVNNSFAAVSPDGQWLVSGEWGDQDRLQVFPAPLLNPATPRTGGDLPQAPQITLDRPVRDVQGCDFVTDTRLLCASDDGSKELFPEDRPLLQVDLTHPLDGTPVTGHVTSLFALPQRSACSGTYEAEGVDYDTTTGTLRVEVVPPGVCKIATTVYSYQQR
ncbi:MULTISPECIES: hypothetical protein [Streptomyces]|uniref:Secreted protein n=1 Tax=Streptomyces thermoviolaceus subsp. thermoviolaceus TaxID=66860 RepID=A0ABX0Z103_STRTL|nr:MULTISPECIES: hypothetical protein [Streptomyces]MCM3266209.1 hypothetical protein [Streptomyces thermoviolaceus]NJP16943.1 hypothetical protein [Streptomyces thermoviolaceus subsp. thermoviolaceus]RSS03020.1 hypothetical protein EF917_13700 [Streptomyces sp. WAC00469]GGV82057.1 hypothetical protein GCM10010499_47140 [Streptomyces thermoviolaceus subsp. apingens]GHB03494.1 hypothetical protein GCM10010512_38650 [Streptomyces thermoviolaceus subsp. thermoviolaceus]